ncbi:MAG: hypothetical protein JXR94_18205, partial [Candidatus Hydrogenedentes bacterium]|nr:hypothetical protein [Candidatus Hydrogenedentota bacterium]
PALRVACALTIAATTWAAEEAPSDMSYRTDPVTRHIHVSYPVPPDAPDCVTAVCSWRAAGADAWRPAKVTPLMSETGHALVRTDDWNGWVTQGRVAEPRAAGLIRTAVFNPYPEAQQGGVVDILFRVRLESPDGAMLATYEMPVAADNSDVVYIEDWTQVLQRDAVATDPGPGEAKWCWQTDLDPAEHASLGNLLAGDAGPERALPQLTYWLDLTGHYAVFVCSVPGKGTVRLRMTGDERTDGIASRHLFEEVFWRWQRMDRQSLVIRQPCRYTGWAPGHIDYVKLVPLSDELAEALDARFGQEQDKLIAGYWEPYSAAFHDDVQDALWHRSYLTAYPEARVSLVDMQIGRFGMKVVYESRETDPLHYATQGDPIGTVARPQTDNVGRMQQFTNTLDASLRYARELGLTLHANFGASNCYPGSPLQGDFSKAHPDWMRGSALRYEVPEVRAYALGLYREALEIGAPGLSLDFCRYPETVDTAATCNTFLSELRALANEFGDKSGRHVPVLVRFPGTGVRRAELFDYGTWAREGWVDYLCPSNLQGRHLNIDVTPYLEAAAGTACQVLPCVDGLGWGLPMPGPFLWRVAQLYEAGVPGVYVYQADARVLGRPEDRRCMRLLASSAAVQAWREEDARLRLSRTKAIYFNTPNHVEGWHGWERVRIWTDGVELGELEVLLDGEIVNRCDGPPYLVGTEDTASDGVIPPGDHHLLIRARDGDGWLEQAFTIHGAG